MTYKFFSDDFDKRNCDEKDLKSIGRGIGISKVEYRKNYSKMQKNKGKLMFLLVRQDFFQIDI